MGKIKKGKEKRENSMLPEAPVAWRCGHRTSRKEGAYNYHHGTDGVKLLTIVWSRAQINTEFNG